MECSFYQIAKQIKWTMPKKLFFVEERNGFWWLLNYQFSTIKK